LRSAIQIFIIAVTLSACGGGGATAVMPPTPNNPVVTPLHDIQGNGAVSPMNGQSVTVRGIVTGDFQAEDADLQNELSGFYLQEEHPDTDPATSDGVFVFDGATPAIDVSVGDRVTVDGTVNEYFGETQITAMRVEVTAAGAGALDHVFASQSLVGQVTGLADWHINTDESPVHDYNLEFGRNPDIFDSTTPYRASDHDPVVIGLNPIN